MGYWLHRFAVKVGPIPDQFDDIQYWLTRHRANDHEQGLGGKAATAIEYRETHGTGGS
jgi:hypothetical protein